MRIKLVYPAQSYLNIETPHPDGSLGLLYIAGALREAGFDVSLLDMYVGEDGDRPEASFLRRTAVDEDSYRAGISLDDFANRISGFDVVATTSIFTSNTREAFEVAQTAKEADPNTLTVCGGGNARALHNLFLDNGFDVIVFGEGEETVVELCRAKAANRDISDIRGIAYRNADGKTVITPPRPAPVDLDSLPMPAWDLLPRQRYWDLGRPPGGSFHGEGQMRYLSMQTSRGCPFRCSYCHISKQGDAGKLRIKGDERFEAELDMLHELGAEHIFFQDDSLLAKRERVLRLFEIMKKKPSMRFYDYNGVNIRHLYKGNAVNPILDLDFLDAMKEGGMTHLALAFESGSNRIVKKYSTNKWDRQRHNTAEMLREMNNRGFSTEGYFMIGYPDETEDELLETFLLARQMVEEGLQYAIFSIVTPYPDNLLYEMAKANGHLPEIIDWKKMKFQMPMMINTTLPPEVISYSRRLGYFLIHSKERIDFRRTGVDVFADTDALAS